VLGLTLLALLQTADPLAVVDDEIRREHDMLHYRIAVSIPDEGASITGATTAQYIIRGGAGPLRLDFDPVFRIDSVVTSDGRDVRFELRDGILEVAHWGRVGDTLAVTIHYTGEPENGLFIQENVHGNRTAFADNWPNRARHWFPNEDHPSDKAYASFAVEAPRGWKVIANGAFERADTLTSGRTVWQWRTERKIPTYTMVIGGGEMSVTDISGGSSVPQSVWAFPEDSAFAVHMPFKRAARMVRQYSELIGPFPYAKLAHVESSTRFGGMENSSAIFYTERGYQSRSMGESVVAHETAHQWFGDAVTEHDWHHLWLSEGFASYFDPVFYESMGEMDRFRESMQQKKAAYLASDVVNRPVIDTTEKNLFALLNSNNYPKGAWILHMLRRQMGDEPFFDGVREYYVTYRDSTALSADLLVIMERHAEQPLRWFFEQWLLQPGYPQLDLAWSYDAAGRSVTARVRQVQDDAWGTFTIAVPLRLELEGRVLNTTAEFAGGHEVTVRFDDVASEPRGIVVDPEGELLLTVTNSRRVN